MKRTLSSISVFALILTILLITPALAVGLEVTDLTDPSLEAADLADQLTGTGVTVSNVTYTGADSAAGTFVGGEGIIGFDDGIILSSGQAADVVGPNESPATTTAHGLPGDDDLTTLGGVSTFDASILEFEFVPDADTVFFQYVFGSEEYNEFVSAPLTGVNDTFAFFVNDTNCAEVPNPDDPSNPYPTSITTVNNGQPGVSPINSDLYINNDPFNPDSTGETVPTEDLLDTEMDGLTVVLTCEAAVNEGVANTMKLAIADGGDSILDSWVLIQGGSLTTDPDPDPDPDPDLVFQGATATGTGTAWTDAEGLPSRGKNAAPNNWFLFSHTDQETNLVTGQKLTVIGDIEFDVDGSTTTINITLDGDWELAETGGNVKIHPMSCSPTAYIPPGQFDYHFTDELTVNVPTHDCYAIHLDVGQWIPDPDIP